MTIMNSRVKLKQLVICQELPDNHLLNSILLVGFSAPLRHGPRKRWRDVIWKYFIHNGIDEDKWREAASAINNSRPLAIIPPISEFCCQIFLIGQISDTLIFNGPAV